MNAPEHFAGGEPVGESRSSVEITLNSKREPQVKVKVYVGDTVEDVVRARTIAIENYTTLLQELGIGRAA